MLKFEPSVFAVENSYCIVAVTQKPAIVTVTVNGTVFTDAQAGVVSSIGNIRKITVPQAILNQAAAYTVTVHTVVERKPYFPAFEAPVSRRFSFKVPKAGQTLRAYMLADTHNRFEEPVAAAQKFGEIDLLLLNGDIVDPVYSEKEIEQMYALTGRLTGGGVPMVLSRGNHDTRGCYAERFGLHTPNSNGNFFYTVRLGSLWVLVLDCGEDKPDNHPEYGNTANFHPYRMQQIDFLKSLVQNAGREYNAPGITHRIVLCHFPFPIQYSDTNKSEQQTYAEWMRLLRENIQPDVMLFGHAHEYNAFLPGNDRDLFGLPCPAIVGSTLSKQSWGGVGLTLQPGSICATFTESGPNTQPPLTFCLKNHEKNT